MSGSQASTKGQVAISPAEQVVVPILGMHRCGGSLVARLLNLMGMELGWPLQPVSSENLRGFWEHKLFQAVNMQLLSGFGFHPDAFGTPEALINFSKQMALTQLSAEDKADLGARIGSNFMQPVWGWKDPRTAVSWPFWSRLLRDLGYQQIKPVVIVRHPDACFRNLQKWGHVQGPAATVGMSEKDFVHSMWWGSYQAILGADLDDSQTLVLCFEDLLNPEIAPVELARLAEHIDAPPESCQAALDWIEFQDSPRDPESEDPELALLYKGLCGLVEEQRLAFLQANPTVLVSTPSPPLERDPHLETAEYTVFQVSPSGYPHAAAFDEVAQTLHYGLGALGIPAPIVKRVEDIQGIPIVVGANLIGRFVDTLDIADALPADTILLNLEQIDASSEWMTDNYLELLGRFRVWDYSPANADRLAQLGVHVEGICGIGHVPQLERIAQDVEEDIDVLFYGGMNERRQSVLNSLREKGLNVVVAANCFGQARDDLVSRAKVVLNIHFYEAKVLEMVRISYLLANGQCVVSETGVDSEEEVIFRDAIAFSSYEGLVEKCVELVEDHPQRARIAAEAKSLFSSMKQSEILTRLLK